jgi:uncharacterized membrane protein YphA (DoxX/SURF4 family)
MIVMKGNGRVLFSVSRIAVASVWLYQGLWCKLLGGSKSQKEIIHVASGYSSNLLTTATVAIGVFEVILALWILSGKRLRAAAWVQTITLVCMNSAGLIWARSLIHDPGAMITENIVLLSLAWVIAEESLVSSR